MNIPDSVIDPATADPDVWSYVVALKEDAWPHWDSPGQIIKYNGCRRGLTGRWNLRHLASGLPVGWHYVDDEVVVLQVLNIVQRDPAVEAARRDPDFDSDCSVHGVATWSTERGHEVVHYCHDGCPDDCALAGEETGEWCDGPLQMRSEDGMPEGIVRVIGDAPCGCGQTLEVDEEGSVTCCVCGARALSGPGACQSTSGELKR